MTGSGVGNEVSGEVRGSVVQAGSIQNVVLTGAREEQPVPRQLPAAVRDFTGRTEHLAALDALLPAEHSADDSGAVLVAALDGTAGVGKTTLAVRWAHRVQHRFPDGTLFANLRGYGPSGPVNPVQVLGGFLHALGVPEERIPGELDAQTGLYRSLLAQRQSLVVLDNAGTPEQVRALLPGTPGCAVVVTSRASLTGLVVSDGARRVTLDLLTRDEALELVHGIVGDERATAEPDAVAELIRVCARLPLALRVAATRIAARPHTSVAEVVEEITDEQEGLDALSSSPDDATAVRAVFDWSYALLTDEQARMFRRLGLHPGPDFSVHAAAVLAGTDLTTARRVLDALADTHLIEPVAGKRYRLHDLLQTYAADRARHDDTQADRDHAIHALLTWYAYAADVADRLVHPGMARLDIDLEPPATSISLEDRSQALAWLTSEHANLLAAQRQAVHSGWHPLTMSLAGTLIFLYLLGRPFWTQLLDAERTGLSAAQAAGDRTAEALLFMRRGTTYQHLSHWGESDADFEHELTLARELNDSSQYAEALCGLGRNCLLQKRYAEALDYYSAALPLARETGRPRAEAVIESNLSEIRANLGRYQQALEHAERGLTLRRQVGDTMGEAVALFDAAVAWQGLDRHDTAIELCRESIALYRRLGDSGGELVRPLEAIATSLEHVGDLEQAAQHVREAAAILTDSGDQRADALQQRLHELEARLTPS